MTDNEIISKIKEIISEGECSTDKETIRDIIKLILDNEEHQT